MGKDFRQLLILDFNVRLFMLKNFIKLMKNFKLNLKYYIEVKRWKLYKVCQLTLKDEWGDIKGDLRFRVYFKRSIDITMVPIDFIDSGI